MRMKMCFLLLNQEMHWHSTASVPDCLSSPVRFFAPGAWCCWRFRIWFEGIQQWGTPAQTMKEACGPNTLPSCLWLAKASVRTSNHMTWPVIARKGGGGCLGVGWGWYSGVLLQSPLPPHLSLPPWNPSSGLCLTHKPKHRHAKPPIR